MLIPVLIICALAVALVATTLQCASIVAHIALHQQAGIYADLALNRAISDETVYYQEYIRINGPTVVAQPPPPAPFEQSAYPACPDGSCALVYTIRAQYTGATSAAGNDSAHALQQNAATEQKISLALQVQLLRDAQGPVLMTRSRTLTFRVYDNAPYATLTGLRDAGSAAPGALSAAQGDIAGQTDAPSASPLPSAHGAPYDTDGDTRIHLTALCQNVGQSAPGPPPGAPASFDARTNAWEWAALVKTKPPYNDGLAWGTNPQGAIELPCTSINPIDADNYNTQKTWTTGLDNRAGITQ